MKTIYTLILFALLLTSCGQKQSSKKNETENKEKLILIDVRTVEEYNSSNLKKAINIPLDRIEQDIAKVTTDKNAKIVLHCKSGGRAGKAILILKKLGYSNLTNAGGIEDARKIYPD